ncbi:MAG: efflux RND transporter periplasmic adaptor subunit [Terriglobia bacterium]|nr:efflux RND transporter periplasmic adaptor subunit [Terriglobia bacterium]
MATQRPAFSAPIAEYAASLLAERELGPRSRIAARQVRDLLPGTSVQVYVIEDQDAPVWRLKAVEGEVTPEYEVAYEHGVLGLLAHSRNPLVFDPSILTREDFAHLNVRRTMKSLAVVPVASEETLHGAIEIISFDTALTIADLASVEEVAGVSAIAFASALEYESERNTQLQSITRVTQLYDLERVFNSTLEMDSLLNIIPRKIREILPVQAINLYMVEDENLLLTSRDGEDPTTEMETRYEDAIANAVSDSGEVVLIASAEDERLAARNGAMENGGVRSLIAVPIRDGEFIVGVLEAVNRDDGTPFDEDDLFFLSTISETAASALHNASLLEAERKIQLLETLVQVSNEITSTLNLERVLQVIVNGPQKIMSYDRAAVALEHGGSIQIKAISGKTEVIQSDPEVKRLKHILEWSLISDTETYITCEGDRVKSDREETLAKFGQYFSETGFRSFYALPLMDDQGRLGVLSFESAQRDFLTETQFEFIRVLASQATVALRNASLYTEVPFISFWEPLLQKKQQFKRLDKARKRKYVGAAVAVALFLLLLPIPMRVVGDANISPQTISKVQAEVDGVVGKVLVHEGDHVSRGAVLAEMDDWDFRTALAATQAKYASALSAMNKALAGNDGTEAGVQRIQADYWKAEVTRAQERLDHTKLRSPIDGVVSTPHIETFTGRKLEAGDTFAEVVDTSKARVDVGVDETDIPLVRTGDYAAVKLESFPMQKFRGDVERVSPMSSISEDRRLFFARVEIPNSSGLLRPGMQGVGKVTIGWRPMGYVFLRAPAMWIWSKLWNWFGW